MKERPIIFSGAMVRAILEGRKTQTRRIVKMTPAAREALKGAVHPQTMVDGVWFRWPAGDAMYNVWSDKQVGVPGQKLWVRESWAAWKIYDCVKPSEIAPTKDIEDAIFCRADGEFEEEGERGKWRPSIFMPRWASRLTLEITDVRIERLQDISEADAISEGIRCVTKDGIVQKYCVYDKKDYSLTPWQNMPLTAKKAFEGLWDSINGKKPDCSWADNPWVWVVGFKDISSGESK